MDVEGEPTQGDPVPSPIRQLLRPAGETHYNIDSFHFEIYFSVDRDVSLLLLTCLLWFQSLAKVAICCFVSCFHLAVTSSHCSCFLTHLTRMTPQSPGSVL